ncbi:MAG: hypothetical protein PHN42_00635 [Bacilli bacterium]|nr:hypothetical protein [Bacilli bacterium]
MHTIICPKCNNEISDKSGNCIYCGLSRNIIDQEIARNKYTKQGIMLYKEKHKPLILATELVLLILIFCAYVYLFIPQILNYTKQNKTKSNIENCIDNYNGSWNYEKNICETDIGDVTID